MRPDYGECDTDAPQAKEKNRMEELESQREPENEPDWIIGDATPM